MSTRLSLSDRCGKTRSQLRSGLVWYGTVFALIWHSIPLNICFSLINICFSPIWRLQVLVSLTNIIFCRVGWCFFWKLLEQTDLELILRPRAAPKRLGTSIPEQGLEAGVYASSCKKWRCSRRSNPLARPQVVYRWLFECQRDFSHILWETMRYGSLHRSLSHHRPSLNWRTIRSPLCVTNCNGDALILAKIRFI